MKKQTVILLLLLSCGIQLSAQSYSNPKQKKYFSIGFANPFGTFGNPSEIDNPTVIDIYQGRDNYGGTRGFTAEIGLFEEIKMPPFPERLKLNFNIAGSFSVIDVESTPYRWNTGAISNFNTIEGGFGLFLTYNFQDFALFDFGYTAMPSLGLTPIYETTVSSTDLIDVKPFFLLQNGIHIGTRLDDKFMLALEIRTGTGRFDFEDEDVDLFKTELPVRIVCFSAGYCF